MRNFQPIRLSAMHHAHVAHGAVFRDEGDWRVAEAFTGPTDEAARAVEAVGLADASAIGKLQVRGAAVEALLAKLAGAERLPPGAAVRLSLDGARILACRLAVDELLVLTAPAESAAVAELVARGAASVGCAHLTDLTAGLAAIDLVGPRVGPLLAKVVPFDLSPAAVVQGELARVRATLVRLDGLRAPGYRALVAREHGAFVWEVLVDAGRDLDLVLIGAAARALLETTPLSPVGGEGRGEGVPA